MEYSNYRNDGGTSCFGDPLSGVNSQGFLSSNCVNFLLSEIFGAGEDAIVVDEVDCVTENFIQKNTIKRI